MKAKKSKKGTPHSHIKKYYILTFGCQMNVYDSHMMSSLLEESGYEKSDSMEKSDVIVINTCSVREHAVHRALSRINSMRNLKKRNPQLRIGITGCIPQQMKNRLKEELDFVDFILGPDNLSYIPSCAHKRDGIFVELSEQVTYSKNRPARGNYPEAFVAVMRGCNNFCSYCVVPYTRGREKSRPLEDIVQEITELSEKGYKRVILLGQNVNNYTYRGKNLSHLLAAITRIDPIERIGFLTSHPAYFPFQVLDIMKSESKIERYLHLPLQSGSSRILKLMKRNYTMKEYLTIIDKIRKEIEDISLSTDIIVGFPTETEMDFRKTIEVVKKIEFDFAYMFKYSTRKNTLANVFIDNIEEKTKKERLIRLIKTQSSITKKRSQGCKGKELDILITGLNRKNYLESVGQSLYNKRVVVKGQFNKGDVVRVTIDDVKGWTLIGTPLSTTRKIENN
jgi:tRNA-2-methylthio-N6-dimethylallyladenosine synthase